MPTIPVIDQPTPRFTIESLPPQQRAEVRRQADAAKALLVKALLRRHSPGSFTISGDPDSLEARYAEVVDAIDARQFARMRPQIQVLRDDVATRARRLGGASNMDLHKPLDALVLQFAGLKPKPKLDINVPIPKWGRALLVMRYLKAEDTTNPEIGSDSMVFGGTLIGPAGDAKAISAFVAGDFDDGHVQDFGSLQLGSVSLKTTPGYPKAIFATFLLVESDSDDQEVAQTVSMICKTAAGAVTAAGFPVVAAAVYAIGEVIGLMSGLFDEDFFPPYGIEARLVSALEFGQDGVDKNRHTGLIAGHGGAYRVGYRWELVA
jgi:hypothetical protein